MPQEPTYRVTLPGGERGTLIVTTGNAPDRAQIVRVTGPGGSGRPVDATVEVDLNGFIVRGRVEERNGPIREAIRRDDVFLVRDGGGQGTIALNRPLLTAVDLVSWLGIRVVGRKPAYFWLLAYDYSGVPRLDSVLVETLPTPPTERRLRVTITDLRDRSRKVGEVRVDLATGAVAEVGPPLYDTTLTLARKPFDDPPGQKLLVFRSGFIVRTTPEADGFRVRLLQDGRQRLESVLTDDRLAPARIAHRVAGKAFTATVESNRLIWELESGPAQRIALPGDQTWLPPYLIATSLWEERGFFSLAPGQKREGNLLLFGDKPETFTLERFVDEGANRRYKLASASVSFDLTTDGKRLVRLVGPDGMEIVRG